MNLEQKHMVENNRICMLITLVIQIAMVFTTIAYKEGRTFPTSIMLIVLVACIFTTVFGFMKLGKNKNGHFPLLLSMAVSYLFMLLGAVQTPYLYAFAMLIGIDVVIYNDAKICLLATITAIVENTIFIVFYYISGGSSHVSSTFMVPTDYGFVIVFAIICYVVVKTNERQNNENLQEIEDKAVAQQKSAEIIRTTSEKISAKLEEANDAMGSLSDKVNSSTEAVDQISSSVTLTAEAIQTQTEMNANIMGSLENISVESKEMLNLSDVVKNNVSEGNSIIQELQKQADESASINVQTAEMTDELANSAETVKDIVKTILGISSQTNLLALNASIEAARAGEAGKGFAVVADEIRQLSENTKQSAEQISETIDGLIKSVHSASDNMHLSVDSSNKQGEMIKETGTKFADILDSVNVLSENVQQISTNVESCAQATNTVMEAITDLSATSQEVAASSESSLTLSQQCVDDMETTNGILNEILALSRHEAE